MKVLIATGGTGGHIFPAIKVAQILRQRGHTVMFAGVLGMAEDQIISAGFDLINIRVKGFNARSLWGVVTFAWLMVAAIARSLGIVRQFAPDKVIGFGGYGSFPVLAAASLLRVPTMLHEQNVFPGKANRLMGHFVQKIAISFEDSKVYFNQHKVVLTGCPCNHHQSIQTKPELRAKFGLDPYKTTILLLGGSQGSQKLNEVFTGFVRRLKDDATVQVIHMTGKNEYEHYHRIYQQEHLPGVVCAFISNIEEAYGACDAVVTRAGASSITEVGLLGLPAIIVPYPFAGGHQRHNALVLERLGNGLIIEQGQLTVNVLHEAFKNIFNKAENQEERKMRVKGVLLADAPLRVAQVLEAL